MNQEVSQEAVIDADLLRRKALDFRTRVLAGEELSEAEQIEALQAIRQLRKSAATSVSKKAASSTPTRSAGELLSLFKTPQNKLPGQ